MRREFDDLAAFYNAFSYGNRLNIAPDQHLPLTAVEATAPLHHLFSYAENRLGPIIATQQLLPAIPRLTPPVQHLPPTLP